MKRLILSLAGILLSTAAHADWYTPSASAPSECYAAARGAHPETGWVAQYGRENVVSSPIQDLGPEARAVAVAVKMGGDVMVTTYASSREACEEMVRREEASGGQWSAVDTQQIRAQAAAAGEPWYLMAPQFQTCMKVSDALPGVHTPEDYVAFAAQGNQSLAIQRNGQDIALLVDRNLGGPTIAMVRGEARCALAMKRIAGL